ncbi:tumor necrosis factor receptor superfamily member 1A isoform 1-T1 [Mantella aurantiaca]
MRALLLLASFLWVLHSTQQALNVPLPNAVLVLGEPVGFITPPHRARRAEKDNVPCESHEFWSKEYSCCCNKCLPGFRVANVCRSEGEKTHCQICGSRTYMDRPNHSMGCKACRYCLPQFGQIVLSNCTAQNNTQCGCPAGQFKQKSGNNFLCQECTTCQNGTIAVECHDNKDTICRCFHNFFMDPSEGSCRPCSECQGPDCKFHCPDPVPSKKPEESNRVLFIVFGVITLVLISAVGVYVVYTYYTREHSSSSDTEGNAGQTTICVHQESEKHNLLDLPGYTKDNPYIVHQLSRQSTDETLPLPDITKGTAPPCLSSPKVLYAIIESIPISRWREFVRRLGLSNYVIEASEQDYRLHFRDAQYAMLHAWVTQEGCPTAKRDQLYNVLREINLGGCIEKIEERL